MSAALAFPTPAAPMSGVPALDVLARIAEETDLGDGVRIGGELVPIRTGHHPLWPPALADPRHARYFRGEHQPFRAARPVGRRGGDFCRRLGETLQPYLFR